MSNKKRSTIKSSDPFYVSKGYKYNLFNDFVSQELSSMCKAVNYYFDKLTFDKWNQYTKFNQTTGGRPRYSYQRMLKIYLYSLYTKDSLRQLNYKFSYGSEYSYLNDGLEQYPKRSSFSNFLKLLDEQIVDIFYQFIELLHQELKLNFSEIFCDGTILSAYNNSDHVVTKDRITQSNTKHHNILIKQESSEETKIKSAYKLLRNEELSIKLAQFGRNSFGLIDEDSVLLKNKNGSFCAGYNVQLYEEGRYGFIVHTHISNLNPDGITVIPTYNAYHYKDRIQTFIADSGYYIGEANRHFKDSKIKFISKERVGKRFIDRHPGWIISEDMESLICSEGNVLTRWKKINYSRGYAQVHFGASAKDCKECPIRSRCIGAKKVSAKYLGVDIDKAIMDAYMGELLNTSESESTYKARNNKCETPFGFIKNILQVNQFKRKGLVKNQTIVYLLAILFNLSRVINIKLND